MESANQRRTGVWSIETRRWVILTIGVVGAWIAYSIRETLTPLVIALLLAYLLGPLVAFVQRKLRAPRLLAVVLVYLVLIGLVVAAFATLVPILFRQVTAFASGLDNLLLQISAAAKSAPWLDALGIPTDAATLSDQLRAEIAVLASAAPRVLAGAASGFLSIVFILVLSLYLLKDADLIERNLANAVPDHYRDEMQRIKTELNEIWSSFLRGQVVLALIIGFVTTIVLVLLGVRNALLLGLLAGLLEVVPTIGPIIAMIPAIVIALFQGSANLPVENTTFAIIVVVAYLLIQQLENHVVVPNVLGSSVNLPPVVVLFGAFAGASLAGVLGIFLAAPVLATARLVGKFLLNKLLEPT
ncbi:Sodium-lithium/proton antiporter [Anaerolineae bacterium]|nr:Sodium-lithium/proton antiporter [Anaerolineae bacterium]